MSGLDRTIAALDVLGSVVQAVPVVGENLKSATEIAKKICETVKKMKENREGYEKLADRAAMLLADIANTLMKASPEKLKGMEANITRLLSTLQEIISATETRLQVPAAPTKKLAGIKRYIRVKGKDARRVSADQDQIKKLGETLDRAIEVFGLTSSIRSELFLEDVRALSVRLLKRVEEMNESTSRTAMNDTLKSLHPVISADWDEVKIAPCMEDTRIQLLANITSWVETPSAPVVFWLNGLAGTGKSTIARTICEHFAKKGTLGASFFFSKQVAERRHAPNVVRTIAYQLARRQQTIATALSDTLQKFPDLASSEGLQKLATELLFKPTSLLATDAGLLIVIDAMDECTEDESGRPGGDLLPLLLRGLLDISGRIKLLLTSRVEPAITRIFKDASLSTQQVIMRLHESTVVHADIRTYLTRSFADIVKDHPDMDLVDWPSQNDLDTVASLAGALFVFAATVVRFVGTPKQNPRARLDIMLARRESNSASPYRFLDRLYLQVLRTSVRSEEPEDEAMLSESLRIVVGSIVGAQQPLSVAVHALLLNMDPADVQLVVGSLSSLLLVASEESVRIFHPSFPDFVVDSGRCNEARFLVSLDEHHLRLARGCLALLNSHLRYNIANLDSPDVANSDVDDLDDKLLRGICHGNHKLAPALPQAIFYAARYWVTHLASTSMKDSDLLDTLSSFCDNHVLRPRLNTTRTPKDRVLIAERVKDARGWEGSKDVCR